MIFGSIGRCPACNKYQDRCICNAPAEIAQLKADNQRLRGLILKALDRWWPFVHGAIGASQTSRALFEELCDGIQHGAGAVPESSAELIGKIEAIIDSTTFFRYSAEGKAIGALLTQLREIK